MLAPSVSQSVPGIDVLGPRLAVVVLTTVAGIGLTVASNLLWRNTDRLFSLNVYVRTVLVFAGAAVVVLFLAERTGISSRVASQAFYAVLLAKLTEQVFTLVSG